MNVSTISNSMLKSLSARSEERSRELQGVTQEFSRAEQAYRQAVKSGNEGAIAAAQVEIEKAGTKMKALVELSSLVNRIINSIIEKIGQIGR